MTVIANCDAAGLGLTEWLSVCLSVRPPDFRNKPESTSTSTNPVRSSAQSVRRSAPYSFIHRSKHIIMFSKRYLHLWHAKFSVNGGNLISISCHFPVTPDRSDPMQHTSTHSVSLGQGGCCETFTCAPAFSVLPYQFRLVECEPPNELADFSNSICRQNIRLVSII